MPDDAYMDQEKKELNGVRDQTTANISFWHLISLKGFCSKVLDLLCLSIPSSPSNQHKNVKNIGQ